MSGSALFAELCLQLSVKEFAAGTSVDAGAAAEATPPNGSTASRRSKQNRVLLSLTYDGDRLKDAFTTVLVALFGNFVGALFVGTLFRASQIFYSDALQV